MSTMVLPTTHARLDRARRRLESERLDGLLITKPENRTYVSGFTGSAGTVLLTRERAHLLVDFRYIEQAALEAPGFERVRVTSHLDGPAEQSAALGLRRIGFEAEAVTVAMLRRWEEKHPDGEFVPIEGLDHLRWRKDPDEVARMKRAAALAGAAFQSLLAQVKPGIRERDLALELEYQIRKTGADGLAFETIVASGARSALPHGRAGDKPLAQGDFVTFDFGAVVDGYRSDCTRTVVVGRASPDQRRVYETVLAALQAAESSLRPGMTGREADAVAREVITAAGHGEAFGHGLGHGVGLAVHEGPTLSPREEAVLEAGVVVTIEPGIYLPGWGGVRIEDLVVLRETGIEILTDLPRDLLEV